MSIMRNLLNIILIVCVYLNWGCTEGAQERDTGTVDCHTGSNTKEPLHVVHKYVVYAPLKRDRVTRLDLDTILRQDRARLDYIHSKLSNSVADRPRQTGSKDILVKDVSKSKNELGSGSYIVTIGNEKT